MQSVIILPYFPVIMSRSIEQVLKFDRPFLFMLRAGPNILFMGQFTGDHPPTFNDPKDWVANTIPAEYNMKNFMKKE